MNRSVRCPPFRVSEASNQPTDNAHPKGWTPNDSSAPRPRFFGRRILVASTATVFILCLSFSPSKADDVPKQTNPASRPVDPSSILHSPSSSFIPPVPSLNAALSSRQDLWGLAAMRQTNRPSYEFFAPLLPPLRYVNAAFRHYPIVLSAPGSLQKARLVSNGSAINARAHLNTWKDSGIPITFYIGETNELFGRDLN